MDGHAVEGLGLADDAENEVRELRRGVKQQPVLQGACGDLDESVFGDEAKWSRHACISASDVAELLRPKSGWLGQRPRGKKTLAPPSRAPPSRPRGSRCCGWAEAPSASPETSGTSPGDDFSDSTGHETVGRRRGVDTLPARWEE